MTALDQKYAQVSDGCWQSPTAVQVGYHSGVWPGDWKCLFHGHHPFVPNMFMLCSAVWRKAHADGSCSLCVCIVQRFSAQRAAYEKRSLSLYAFLTLTHVICSHSMGGHILVSAQRACSCGPYLANPFRRLWSRQASLADCRLLCMFLIRLQTRHMGCLCVSLTTTTCAN